MPRAKKSQSALVTSLMDSVVCKRDHDKPGDTQWPANDPNVSDEHSGYIKAAWVDPEGSLKLLVVTPTKGRLFETYAECVTFVRGPQ
jgi:hypothetical protein